MLNAYEAYKQQALNITDPKEVVGKMFDKAAISLKRATIAIREGNIETANNNILKAENIVTALDGALDMRYPVSSQLRQLYQYFLKKMFLANAKKDTEILNEVAGYMFELRDTWEKVVASAATPNR